MGKSRHLWIRDSQGCDGAAMLFVLVKGDSCLEPIQENPEDLVTKWSFVPGLSLPPSHLLPDPAASVISSFLTSLIFPFHCLLPCGQHNCSGCPDPKTTTKPAHEPVSLKVTVPFSSCHRSTAACSTSSPPVYSSTLCSPDPAPPWTAHS